jgi:signal recognition particle receptor subunit beta
VALVDFKERQVTLKLVYYGPPLSGKTTNLRWIHEHVDPLNRGRLMTLDTKDDRTIFFDLLPIFFKTSNLSFRVKVYTVPGQPLHAATRRVVLRGADGVAFVADSQRSEVRANNDSYQNLSQNLEELGLSAVPVVIQYNKLDLPDTLGEDELARFGERSDEPVFGASAINGQGVLDTFIGLLEQTWIAIDRETKLESSFKIGREDFLEAIRRHVDA